MLFAAASVIVRLAPHAPNFAPVGALAFFAGVHVSKRWGWTLPILTMLISDYVIGFYNPVLMASVYGSFLVTVFIGSQTRKKRGAGMIVLGSLAGSVTFFLITNFAVWALSDWYPNTIHGLMMSYTAGLPFFRNTLLGDLLYTGIFFGSYALIMQLKKTLRLSKRCETIQRTGKMKNHSSDVAIAR